MHVKAALPFALLLLLTACATAPPAPGDAKRSGAGADTIRSAALDTVDRAPVDEPKVLIRRGEAIDAARTVTAARFPDADQVTVDYAEQVQYCRDGTYVQWAEAYNKILTEKGKRANRTLSSYFTIPYQRGEVDCKIFLVEVIKPDGSFRTIDLKKNSKLMINASDMGSNIYNPNDKVIRVNIPGLEVGDTVHYIMFDRIVQPRAKNSFSDWLSFQSSIPILHSVREIHGPSDMPLVSIAVKDRVADTLIEHPMRGVGGVNIYRWETHDVPQIIEEPDMPPVYMVGQRVLVSTFTDWPAVSRWYWNLSKPHFEPSQALREKTRALIADALTDRERIQAVFQFVSQEIRYLGITAEADAPGYEPHDVADTFAQKHGVCRDKAALLAVMLREAGFEAFPVLIHQGHRKDPEVPQPYFNHAITAVREAEGRYTLMDATDEKTVQLLPSYLNNKSYLVATPEGETLRASPIDPPSVNMMHINTSAHIDDRGKLTARTVLRFEGINDNVYRGYFARLKPEDRERYFKGAVQAAAAGARITDIAISPENMSDTSQQLAVRMRFEADDVLIGGDQRAMLAAPSLAARVGWVNFLLRDRTSLEKRKYPLLTGAACGVRETLAIDLDPALENVISLPRSEPIETALMTWHQRARQVGTTIAMNTQFSLKRVEFSPAQYLQLKQALKRIEYDQRKMAILAGDGGGSAGESDGPRQPAGDVVVLDERVDLDLTGTTSGVLTRRAKLGVLTYAGVKRYSELKINYVPAWEEVKILNASVRKRTGEMVKISEKEINIMDAPGSGATPRYPERKVLVASIPGVEVGATIEYAYEVRYRDRHMLGFIEPMQSFDPIRKKTLSVTGPEGLQGGWLQPTHGDATGGEIIDGRQRLEWSAENAPAIAREDDLPPLWSFAPTVFVRAATEKRPRPFEHVIEAFGRELAGASINQPVATAQAEQLVDGLESDEARVIAIRDFVAKRIRATGPEWTQMPLKYITPADRTLADGYGNSADRAILLAAMLRGVGFEPQFVLASELPRIAAMQQLIAPARHVDMFDTVLVRLTLADTRHVYLNDTSQYAAIGTTPHHGRPGILLPGMKDITVEALPDHRERTDVTYQVVLDASGDAVITRTQHFYGTQFAAKKRFYDEITPELLRRHQQELASDIAQSATFQGDIEGDFTSYPGSESYTVAVEDYAVRDGEFLYLELPSSFRNMLRLRGDTRRHPLHATSDQQVRLVMTISAPPSLEPVVLPEAIKQESAVGAIDYGVSKPPRLGGPDPAATVQINGEARMLPALVMPSEYGELFDLAGRLGHRGARTILFQTRDQRAAPTGGRMPPGD